jgi:hypothetical protein
MKLSHALSLRKLVRIGIAVVAAATVLPGLAAAAQNDYWSPHSGSRDSLATAKGVARQSFPKEFRLFDLDLGPLSKELHSVTDNRRRSTVIFLPNADGGLEQFEVFEASNFEPELQARFPQIRAFSGKSLANPSETLKLSLSPQGIQSMVFRTDRDNEFIEAYSADHRVYAVYRSQRARGQLPWTCSTEDRNMAASIKGELAGLDRPESNTGEHRTMRLAQSCNGEYSNFFGASTAGTPADEALVLAAFNATLTRCNGVYERDLAIHLNLIANTTAVIFYNPATDPYTLPISNWNGQLQATLTSLIGDANYDIGHMFGGSGGGGNAGCIGCVCVAGTKGRGITSPADAIPMGDNFDIDYVAHEVGHQMGANHSFSFQNEGTGQNKEVGSGITVMGYAGITAQDVAPHSIDTFHETNIQQIQVNMATKACPVTTAMNPADNAPPVLIPVVPATIPISTPFELIGSATDPNGDALTYQWEQDDVATTFGNNSVASPGKLTGPNWLSFVPSTSPTRTFPRLSTLQAGLMVTPPFPGGDAIANIEALSSVSRTLNFRLTVRDNHPYTSTAPLVVGQTQFTNVAVTVSNTSGPFAVTAPNTAVTWTQGNSETVSWNVANTTAAPVSCPLVDISLSTDSGATFPTVLATATVNDGSESVIAPGITTSTARVKVKCANNIFFDISNANFTIAPVPVELFGFDVQ